jgi:hypothetical protein
MREIRQSGSEGGEPQLNAASLPLSFESRADGTWKVPDGTWKVPASAPLKASKREGVSPFMGLI